MSYKKITTLAIAYSSLNLEISIRPDLSAIPDDIARGMQAFMDATVVTQAMRIAENPKNPFLPNYNDRKQNKYGPWAWGGAADGTGAGFSVDVFAWANTFTYASGGSRLACPDPAWVRHIIKYFPNLYKEIFLVLSGKPLYEI